MQCHQWFRRHVYRLRWMRVGAIQPLPSRAMTTGSDSRAAPPTPRSKFSHQRVSALGGAQNLPAYFPRLEQNQDVCTAAEFLALGRDGVEKAAESSSTVYGRITSRRKQGSKLLFIDIESGGTVLQIVLNQSTLPSDDGQASSKFHKTVQRGDWIAATGTRYQTSTGQPSLLASYVPQVLSVSLQPLPEQVSDPDFISKHRHVERILKSEANDALILRHRLISTMRSFFDGHNFTEVSTPLLASGFGGAVARPFETSASEFPSTTLNLRIAPELWLKRLIVGNLDRVFEIGPAFRNEGVDATHNPEFTICEFYQTMASLEQLMSITEQLFALLAKTSEAARGSLKSIPDPIQLGLDKPFKRIDFVPAIEAAMREHSAQWMFPDLDAADAADKLTEAIDILGLGRPVVEPASVPKLLDVLSSELLESSISSPTWIIHHPECMSPLAKSFKRSHGDTKHNAFSARAELFILGREYVNCYEEENSPVEQRRKFEDQLYHRNIEGSSVIDESYLEVLEWGMPPTGGWGCGIDRLVMLLSGRRRIADVLPFGTLTNVAGLGSRPGSP